MKRTIYLACCIFVGLILNTDATAQIEHGGEPVSFKAMGLVAQSEVPVMKMKEFDPEAMLAEDEKNNRNKIGPWRFGKNFEVNYDINHSGIWESLPDGGRVWRIALFSPGALHLNFEFSSYHLPVGANVFMYNPDHTEVFGAWTHQNNKKNGRLATTLIGGSTAIIEYYEPRTVTGQGALTIGRITHGYRPMFGYTKNNNPQNGSAKGLGDSGPCNNNVICPEGDNWRCQIKSVAIIIVNGNEHCTGSLLNNATENEMPYLLTADHCLSSPVSNWLFRFNWESPICNQNQNGPTNQTISGATIQVTNEGSDMGLLLLSSAIPDNYDVFYSGWDATGTIPNEQTVIHHPSGDIKKISFDTNSPSKVSWGGSETWQIGNWEDGTTEQGSSGSGLWDQNGRIIGQLYGGSASCFSAASDYFGRFDVSWNAGLSDYLDPGNTGIMILEGKGNNACEGPVFSVDASIQSIDGIEDNYCGEHTIAPAVTIRNNGSNPLTSVDVDYDLNNGGAVGTVSYTQTIAPEAIATVNLPALTLIPGINTLYVTTNHPNGGTDDNPANDFASESFTAVIHPRMVTVDVMTDLFGSETTWEITDPQENIFGSGGPYLDDQNGTLESETVCLEKGVCYDFTIYDSFGDGICCGSFGNGSYAVYADSTIYATGGDFDSAETTGFCIPVGMDAFALHGWKMYPNPTGGTITIDMAGMDTGYMNICVYNIMGEKVAEQHLNDNGQPVIFDLTGHSDGVYLLEVRTAKTKAVRKVILNKL